MRRYGLLLIVAGMALGMYGCRADHASPRASAGDARTSDLPQAEAPDPSAATAVADQAMPDAAPNAAHDARPLLVCFGDSLTAGFGTDPGQSYPDYLQADLDTMGYKYRVVNAGVSGNTTKDGVERLNSIVALNPAVVVVEFGGNDGLRGLRIEDSRKNLDTIVATLKASGTKVVLAGITLPPNYGPDYVKQFDATYTLLAKKYQVPMLPFLLNGVFGVDGMMQADRTHATASGNKVVAKNVLPLVLPLLKK
jgi:acyl-CoA thioesterase I